MEDLQVPLHCTGDSTGSTKATYKLEGCKEERDLSSSEATLHALQAQQQELHKEETPRTLQSPWEPCSF